MPYHFIKVTGENEPLYIGSPALIKQNGATVPNYQKDVTRAGLFDSERLGNVLKILPLQSGGRELIRL